MDADGPFLSVAETAERLGLTPRALRLYERKGLVKPRRTAAGWRVYGRAELERLHKAVALKAMGLPLARIAALFEDGVELAAVLALQEQALVARAMDTARAVTLVRKARARLAAGAPLDTDDMIALTKEAAMADQKQSPDMQLLAKHLTPDQLGRLMLHYALTPEARGSRERIRILAERAEALAGGDPASPEAQALARDWAAEHLRSGVKDPDILAALQKVAEEQARGAAGPSKAALDFVRAARAHAAGEGSASALLAKHLSPEQLGRLALRFDDPETRWTQQRAVELVVRAEALAGGDPGSPEALALARAWRDHTRAAVAKDPELMLALKRAWEEEYARPDAGPGLPMSKAAWDFLHAALAKLPEGETNLTRFLGVAPRLPVRDLRRTVAFYKDVLGFGGAEGLAETDKFAIVGREGASLQFYVPDTERPEPYGEGVTICLEVEDARPVYEAVKDKVTIDWGPEVYWYGRRELSFKDPEGYAVIVTAVTGDPVECEQDH